MRVCFRAVFFRVFPVVLSGPFLLFAENQLPSPELRRAVTAVGKIQNDDFSGSGFFLEDKTTFVTAFHVMEKLLEGAPFHSLKISQGERQYKLRGIKRLSALYDAAFLEVTGYEGPVLKLSDTSNPRNTGAYLMGFSARGDGGFYTLKGEIITGNSDPYRGFIGDTAFMPGFSGGPVLNNEGRVMGIVSYGFSNMTFTNHQSSGGLRDLLGLGSLEGKDSVSPKEWIESEAQNLEKTAEGGHALAQYRLGLRLNRTDRKQAVQWFERAAEQGFTAAQSDFALALLRGSGVQQDKGKAAYWFERAARRGFPPAQVNLGSLLKEGEGIPRDMEKALYWYKLSAEAGFAPGQFQTAWMLREGLGAPQDKEEAAYWYEMAAKRGFPRRKFTWPKC